LIVNYLSKPFTLNQQETLGIVGSLIPSNIVPFSGNKCNNQDIVVREIKSDWEY
jgi:hypothetical protein